MIPAADARILAAWTDRAPPVVAVADDDYSPPRGRMWRHASHSVNSARRDVALYSDGWRNARIYQRAENGEWQALS